MNLSIFIVVREQAPTLVMRAWIKLSHTAENKAIRDESNHELSPTLSQSYSKLTQQG